MTMQLQQGSPKRAKQSTYYTVSPNQNTSYASKKDAIHHHLNTSKLNRTIVNELIDHEHQEDVMDRIEVQNNIVENINGTPNYQQEYVVPAEELDDIRQKHGSDIFHCMAPDFRLEDIFEMRHYRLVRGGSTASVYSLDSSHRTLKLVMELPHSREKVLAALIDPANYHLWNDQVDFGNIKLRIYSENTVIAYQKHRAFDSHFRERDFLYIRHLFQKSGVIYMADKSIEHASFPPFDYMARGEIKYGIWAFEELSNSSTRVIYLLHMDFGDTLSSNKSAESMIRYLESMARLSRYLSRNGRIPTMIAAYFDISWGTVVTASRGNILKHKWCEEEDEISFDSEQELYLTAFPKAEWHDHTMDQSFPTQRLGEQCHIAPFSKHSNKHQHLHNEVFNQATNLKQNLNIPQRQAIQKSNYNITDLSNQTCFSKELPHNSNVGNRQVQHEISPLPRSLSSNTREYLPDRTNFTRPVQMQAFNSKTVVHQQLIETSSRPLIFSPQSPRTSGVVTFQSRMPKQQQNLMPINVADQTINRAPISQPKTRAQQHSSREQDCQISKPEKIHVFKQVPIKLDANGLTILPQDYLSVKHKLSPVKSEYKIFKRSGWKNYFLRDIWQCLPTGELRCINEKLLKQQRGVLGYILKKLSSNLFSGKSIMNISLPVVIFGDLSVLEIIARNFGFAPLFLERAAAEPDPVERLKIVTVFSIAFTSLQIEMEKPFNPILGETYQGWVNGCPVYCEQISHHPPVSAFLMIGRGYRVFGASEPKLQVGINSGKGNYQCEYTIQFERFADNPAYFQLMSAQLTGVSYGERLLQRVGSSHIYDKEGHFLELTFNPSKKGMFSFGKQSKPADWVEGSLVKTSPAFVEKFRKDKKRQGPSKKDISQTVATVSGRWSELVKFDEFVSYDVQRDQPCVVQEEPYPLNSNCCYREDIVYKRKNDLARAQIEKERLEILQREDKKLRKETH